MTKKTTRLQLLLLPLLLCFSSGALAQGADKEARAAQWDSYTLPAGSFVRFAEKQKGYSFWYPSEWKQSTDFSGMLSFSASQNGPDVRIYTGEVPDGYGLANFATAILQQWRTQPIKQETMISRRVLVNGVEGREFTFEIESEPGRVLHETVWLTAVGSRAYVFYFVTDPHERGKYEPYFKRMMLSVRIGAAGHWDEEFENMRARFNTGTAAIAGREVEAALLGEALRAGQEAAEKLVGRLAELAVRAPDAALDLLTDYDPQVRAAAIEAFGKLQDERATEAILWSLGDKDAYAGATAARVLAARGPAGLAALRGKLSTLTKDPGVIVRAGAALTDEAARDLASELLKSDQSQSQLAGLYLATALPLKGLSLPYQKLFVSNEVEVIAATVGAISQRRATDAMPDLLKLLNGDKELWAVRALGDIAPAEIAHRFTARIKEIDVRFAAIANSKMAQVSPGRRRNRAAAASSPRRVRGGGPKVIVRAGPLKPLPAVKEAQLNEEMEYLLNQGLASPLSLPINTFGSLPEETRLALLRGELVEASEKINFRHRWASAADETARRAVYEEALRKYRLGDWARTALQPSSASAATPVLVDLSQLMNAPTTGETLFPHNTTLYMMVPDFAQTLAKLDGALSGIQMEGVRDQMTFALILKSLKAGLVSKLNAEAIPDASTALGIDLKSPLALAAWPAEDAGESALLQSALVLRVTDRARFERMLALYQKELGGFDSFAAAASGAIRFAGIAPALIPLGLAGLTAENPFGSSRYKRERPLNTLVYFRQESVGSLPVTAIDKLVTYKTEAAERETIYLAYLGATAIIAPTRAALAELLKMGRGQAAIKQSEAFAQARAEEGEVVFFSQPRALLKGLLSNPAPSKEPHENMLSGLVEVLGLEYGSLRLSPSSWETVFHLRLSSDELISTVRPFKAHELSVPRQLLPASTIFYAGAIFDPATLWSGLKSSGLFTERNSLGSEAAKKLIAPKLHGEIGVALVSIAPVLDPSSGEIPSFLIALKLKDQELAAQHRFGKLFTNASPVPDETVLGAPVVSFTDGGYKLFVAIIDDYLLIAESASTLKRLETTDKFATTREWTRAAAASPQSLALFATYSLDAAFDDARSAMAKDESAQRVITVLSALTHAFHSQRAVISVNGNALEGKLAVAFDREGRFSISEVTREAREFDVANAMIAPKGLNIAQPTRTESLRLRITAKQPGVIARVRADVSKFDWQRVETSSDFTLVLSTNARRIPEKQTVQLPVGGAEFAPYLRPTADIHSTAPQIISLAKEIAGTDRDGRSVARKLGQWTYNNLKWKRVESSTLETLASREADCLEHSELYVALARALGLPARVVIGAAFSGGAFTAHAWVEIYLGRWVEVDPTWGMMDYVDSTHLRFDGDSFSSYAMLNQLQLEVLEARTFVADYQRDPVRLVKELGSAKAQDSPEFAWDFALVAERALGAGVFDKLDDKQRNIIIRAFDRTVARELENWRTDWSDPLRILSSEVKDDSATILTLRGEDLLRFTLTADRGVWHIADIEDTDYGLPVFADALRAALHNGMDWRQILSLPSDRALKHIEQLIAANGESERLLFLKALALRNKQFEEMLKEQTEDQEEKSKPPQSEAAPLLKQITTRWPDFAPAQYALGIQLLSYDEEPEQAIAPLRRYAQLMPFDPRPWARLGEALELLKRYDEAETAYREAAARDRESYERQAALVGYYFKREQAPKAKESLTLLLRLAPDANAAFEALDCEGLGIANEGDKDGHRRLEELLLGFQREAASSKSGLRLLAHAQSEQGKYESALQTVQQVLALAPEASDYLWAAQVCRAARRFHAALNAADQAIKLDKEYAEAYFERACALAQLGSKKEAFAALRKAIELNAGLQESLDDADLKPLESLPEFAALLKEQIERK